MERKQRQLAAEEERALTSRAFSAYDHPLNMVTYFRYLGRVISAADDNWLAVIQNLAKSQAVQRRMMRILRREGARLWVYEFFFKAVVQLVLLFCAETWVVTPRMGRVLGRFQYQVAWRLTSGSCGGGETEVVLHIDGDSKNGGGFCDNGYVHPKMWNTAA